MSRPRNSDITNAEYNDDDYVAQLLAKDARDCSLRYSALGVYGPSKRSSNSAPKPNTRFLKHILRETDSHNENLKRKEEEEARQRMRSLRDGRDKPTRSSKLDGRGDGGHKRRRVESSERWDQNEESPRHRHRGGTSRSRKGKRECKNSDDDYDKISRSRKRHHREEGSDSEDAVRGSGLSRHRREVDQDRQSRHHRRQASPNYDYENAETSRSRKSVSHRSRSHRRSHHHHERSRSQSKSPNRTYRRRRHSEKKEENIEKYKHAEDRSHKFRADTQTGIDEKSALSTPRMYIEEAGSRHLSPSGKSSTYSDDSDPLSNLIGPAPPIATTDSSQPVRSRGRGAYRSTHTSNIDAHFSSSYDPTLDVHPEDDHDTKGDHVGRIRPVPGLFNPKETDKHTNDDWDMALEALRDRELWKRKGAERLRQAGFDDRIVEKWEANKSFAGLDANDNKDIETVKWAKKGEGREWDRGKVIDENGHISVKAPW
ncbi:hypothetical protein MGYG_05488 [Nannizzia gypsea CBS 118893]|uniref:Pre-mRNA-splicing factor 38B n=1 Tax=Arthroderma gypseum (strain ATCC MYA-4604 / CBS 118893) TaxID=535722 RepID=E4UW47_ARTGP|nr:hypothetical protein MGYG_05488 [Nannizzia gypsea CBS 118893]EFR02495.1 hypothetical protein MGYG_05488 [Nannizzia gypsea CBS 118893]